MTTTAPRRVRYRTRMANHEFRAGAEWDLALVEAEIRGEWLSEKIREFVQGYAKPRNEQEQLALQGDLSGKLERRSRRRSLDGNQIPRRNFRMDTTEWKQARLMAEMRGEWLGEQICLFLIEYIKPRPGEPGHEEAS